MQHQISLKQMSCNASVPHKKERKENTKHKHIWLWLKIKLEELRGSCSMFPLTKVPFWNSGFLSHRHMTALSFMRDSWANGFADSSDSFDSFAWSPASAAASRRSAGTGHGLGRWGTNRYAHRKGFVQSQFRRKIMTTALATNKTSNPVVKW